MFRHYPKQKCFFNDKILLSYKVEVFELPEMEKEHFADPGHSKTVMDCLHNLLTVEKEGRMQLAAGCTVLLVHLLVYQQTGADYRPGRGSGRRREVGPDTAGAADEGHTGPSSPACSPRR
jgi:hypothetical protein